MIAFQVWRGAAARLRLGESLNHQNKTCHPDRRKIIREADDLSKSRDFAFPECKKSPPKQSLDGAPIGQATR
jgi:hypothetical protein